MSSLLKLCHENKVKIIISKMNHRDYSLDQVCGILIIYMILGHIFQCVGLTQNNLFQWFQRFLFKNQDIVSIAVTILQKIGFSSVLRR